MGKREVFLARNEPNSNRYTYQLASDQLFRQHANMELPPGGMGGTGLTPFAGEWKETQLFHLLRRCTFGLKKAHTDAFRNLSMDQAVSILLNPGEGLPFPPLNNYHATHNDPNVLPGQPWVNASFGNDQINQARIESLKSWWCNLIITESPSILEKLTFFWHHHFSTKTGEVSDARFSYRYLTLLRKNALGNFKKLLKAITIDPAMLVFLNGAENSKDAPDENYARELQELFTLGRRSGYVEEDVRAAAKVLTGWKSDKVTINSFFNPDDHDTTNKQFSAFYNNAVINGRTGADGAIETDELLTLILQQQEASKFICRKLYRWFVYYVIDQDIENNIIIPLSAIFRENNYEIKPVLYALLRSEHFYDQGSKGCYIKTPIDFCMGVMRSFNIGLPISSEALYEATGLLSYYTSTLNMDPGDPPNVSGWPAFHQEPLYYELWINSDTLPKRNIFTDNLLQDGIDAGKGYLLKIDAISFIKQFPNPQAPDAVVQYCIDYLLTNDLPGETKTGMKSILLSNQGSDYYWTTAWDTYINDPGNPAKEEIVSSRLTALLLYVTRLAEFQLC